MGSKILNFWIFVTMFRTFFHEILTRNFLRNIIVNLGKRLCVQITIEWPKCWIAGKKNPANLAG